MNLKGNVIQIFKPNRNTDEVIQCLSSIEPKIQDESTVPHNCPKLDEYPQLKQYFETHMEEGLYLLQFCKCNNVDCCIKRNGNLPPLVPSPVPIPNENHYMPFDSLYGKVKIG